MTGVRYRVCVRVYGDEIVIDGLDETAALQLVIEYKRQGKPVDATAYLPGKP